MQASAALFLSGGACGTSSRCAGKGMPLSTLGSRLQRSASGSHSGSWKRCGSRAVLAPDGGRRTGRCGRSPTSWKRCRLGRRHRRRGLPCANSRRRGRWKRKRRRRRSDPDNSSRSGEQEVQETQRLGKHVPGDPTQRLPYTGRHDRELLPEPNRRSPRGLNNDECLGSSVKISGIGPLSNRAYGVELNLGCDALCGPVGCHKPLPGRNNLPQLTETGPLQGQDFGNLGCCCWIGLALLYFCYFWVRWLAHRPKAAEALQGAGRSVVTNL